MTDVTQKDGAHAAWASKRDRLDDNLYQRYGRALEPEHTGEFVAISDDGRLAIGPTELEVAKKAQREFGPSRFALRRIGADAETRWRRLRG